MDLASLILLKTAKKKGTEMHDERIAQFTQLLPEHFPYVVRHDRWQHYPIDEIGLRDEIELWLCPTQTADALDMLKVRCFHYSALSRAQFFSTLEHSLRLGVRLITHRHLQGQIYAFMNAETQKELFTCQWFEAWLAPKP